MVTISLDRLLIQAQRTLRMMALYYVTIVPIPQQDDSLDELSSDQVGQMHETPPPREKLSFKLTTIRERKKKSCDNSTSDNHRYMGLCIMKTLNLNLRPAVVSSN